MKPRRKGRVSEEVAANVLEKFGFSIIEKRKRVLIDGIEVAEIDLIAKKNGELYAIEVKAGSADVSSIRYTYANAKLLNMKPLIVAKGFSNEAAKIVAKKLGVDVIELSDVFLIDEEELYFIVKEAMKEIFIEILSDLLSCKNLSPDDLNVIKNIGISTSFSEAADRLGVDIKDLARKISELKRNKTIEGNGGFNNLRLNALIMFLCNEIRCPKGAER